jgi:hypothetical protein
MPILDMTGAMAACPVGFPHVASRAGITGIATKTVCLEVTAPGTQRTAHRASADTP